MGSFSGLPVSFVPSWETVVACHGCTSANWATLFCGEQYLVWTWKSSGIGNGMRHILEGTVRFLKSRLDSEDAEQKPYRFFLDWLGNLASYLWAYGYESRRNWTALLHASRHFRWKILLGKRVKSDPSGAVLGKLPAENTKNTEKAGGQPCKTCT